MTLLSLAQQQRPVDVFFKNSISQKFENKIIFVETIAKSTASQHRACRLLLSTTLHRKYLANFCIENIWQISVFLPRSKPFNSFTPEITCILQNKTLESYNQQLFIIWMYNSINYWCIWCICRHVTCCVFCHILKL